MTRRETPTLGLAALLGTLLAVVPASAAPSTAPATRFPLSVHASGRYLVDAGGKPFRIQGDSPWDIVSALTPAEIDRYLTLRQQQGFNTVLLMFAEHKRWHPASHAPATPDGLVPFERPGDLSVPSDAYFERVAWVLSAAARHGMLVLATPLFLGYVGRDDGWWVELNWPVNSREVCRAFGRYLAQGGGKRFKGLKDATNVVWVEGGDFFPLPGSEGALRAHAIMEGLKEGGALQPQTAHWSEEHVASDQPDFAAQMDLQAVYAYGTHHDGNILPVARRGYAFDPGRAPHALPAFLIETQYESNGWLPRSGLKRSLKLAWRQLASIFGSPGQIVTRPVEIRRLLWWAELSDIAGVVYGSEQVCIFDPSWPGLLDTAGIRDMRHLATLLDSLRWWDLAPSGLGALSTAPPLAGSDDTAKGGDVAATATPDGSLLVAYVPGRGTGPRTVGLRTVGAASSLRARWFDPTRGTWTPATVPAPSGELRRLTTPGANGDGDGDWVLVLDRRG